jgi:hypothetical protein
VFASTVIARWIRGGLPISQHGTGSVVVRRPCPAGQRHLGRAIMAVPGCADVRIRQHGSGSVVVRRPCPAGQRHLGRAIMAVPGCADVRIRLGR